MPDKISLIASVLGADFSRLGDECKALEAGGIDAIQWDVMDGQFVPNLTIGPDVIASVRPLVKTPFEAHLMVMTPEKMAKEYVAAGCERIIIHLEACPDIEKSLKSVAGLGVETGIAINPDTPAATLEPVLGLADMVLVMTVNPGFGGQSFMDSVVPKISEVKKLLEESGMEKDIEVDGGIGPETIPAVVNAGANLLVSGSALYKAGNAAGGRKKGKGLKQAVDEFKKIAEAAQLQPV